MSLSFATASQMTSHWQRLLTAHEPSKIDLEIFFREAVRVKSPEWVCRAVRLILSLATFEDAHPAEALWGIGCKVDILSGRVLTALTKELGRDTIPPALKLTVQCVVAGHTLKLDSLSQSSLRRVVVVAIRKRRSTLLKAATARLRSPLAAADLKALVSDIGADTELLEKMLAFVKPFSDLYQGLGKEVVVLLSKQQPWPCEAQHIRKAYCRYTPLGAIMEALVLGDKSEALLEAVKKQLPDRLIRRLLRHVPSSEKAHINLGQLMAACTLVDRSALGFQLPSELGQGGPPLEQCIYQALLVLEEIDSLGSRLAPIVRTLETRDGGLETSTLTQVAVLIVSLSTDQQQALQLLNIWRHTLRKLDRKLHWRTVLQAALRCPTFAEGGLPELVQALFDTLVKVGSWKWRRLREVEGQPEAASVARRIIEAALEKQAAQVNHE